MIVMIPPLSSLISAGSFMPSVTMTLNCRKSFSRSAVTKVYIYPLLGQDSCPTCDTVWKGCSRKGHWPAKCQRSGAAPNALSKSDEWTEKETITENMGRGRKLTMSKWTRPALWWHCSRMQSIWNWWWCPFWWDNSRYLMCSYPLVPVVRAQPCFTWMDYLVVDTFYSQMILV